MAEKFSAIQWFLKELPRLQEDGLLDETSAVRLKEHYEERLAKKPSAKNYFLLAIGLIGGLMIAAGIILVILNNGNDLPCKDHPPARRCSPLVPVSVWSIRHRIFPDGAVRLLHQIPSADVLRRPRVFLLPE